VAADAKSVALLSGSRELGVPGVLLLAPDAALLALIVQQPRQHRARTLINPP